MLEIKNYIYNPINTLGKGSFSTVFLGENIINRQKVAIKKINIKNFKKFESHIMSEINILKNINHLNIINLIDNIVEKDTIYIILEYCSLGDLNEFYKNVMVKEIYVKHYAKQLLDSLRYLHNYNITHRDIKPHNILLSDIYTVKLTDFGFAKENKIDLSSTLCGSPIYMAPEIMQCKEYNSKTDIWSYGVVLYQLLYGTVPYIANNQFELMCVIRDTLPDYNSKYISDDCILFLQLLLNKNPQDRPDINHLSENEWFNNNYEFKKLNSSSTYQLYNEMIISKDSSTQNKTLSSSSSLNVSNEDNIFQFDEEIDQENNNNNTNNTNNFYNTIDLSNSNNTNDVKEYVFIENNYKCENLDKTSTLMYSLSNVYDKFVNNYFYKES